MGIPSTGSAPDTRPQAALWGLRPLIERAGHVATIISGAMLALLLATLFAMVVSRDIFHAGIPWLDDLARYVQIWVVYTGAITLTMQGDHIVMDALYVRLPPSWRKWLRRFTGFVSLVISALVAYLSAVQFWETVRLREVSASGYFPAWIGYISLPVGFVLLTVASLYYLLYWTDKDNPGGDVTGAI